MFENLKNWFVNTYASIGSQPWEQSVLVVMHSWELWVFLFACVCAGWYIYSNLNSDIDEETEED